MIADVNSVALVLRAGQLGVDPARQGWQVEFLERLEQVWLNDAHPITPWFALRWACRFGIQTPAWVLAYFCDAGDRINAVINGPSPSSSEAEGVGRALGFYSDGKGKSAPGASAARNSDAWRLAVEFEAEKAMAAEANRPFKSDAAEHAVAGRNRCSKATVRRAVQQHGTLAQANIELIRSVFCQEIPIS